MGETKRTRLVVLLSGTGTNFAALQQHLLDHEDLRAQIVAVVSDQANAPGLEKAQAFGLSTHVVERNKLSTRDEFEAQLLETVESAEPDWVVLAGFMRILGPLLVQPLAGKIINIHPSLLPKYKGLDTHRRALEAKDRLHGASIHFVNQQLDGGPVLSQVQLEIQPGDTPESLAGRLLVLEHQLMCATVALLIKESVECRDGQIEINGQTLEKPLVLDARLGAWDRSVSKSGSGSL